MVSINILDIVEGTSVDGPGLRTAIYLAGCRHQCRGCHNPESWDFRGGKQMTIRQLLDVIEENDFNVTLSGGDPLYHPEEITELCRMIKCHLGKSIWCYTGFTWEEILKNDRLQLPLPFIDVLVEGRYIEALRNPDLLFRGSSNQRIINVPQTIESGNIKEWEPMF